MELSKPWLDLEGYKKTRMLEAEYEAELAERFLRQGLVRNAAGKAFQAWKALMGAMLADKVAELERLYPGSVEIREGRRVKKAYWILALVPIAPPKDCGPLGRHHMSMSRLFSAVRIVDVWREGDKHAVKARRARS
ncbi:MAG: PaREP1 family protein [Thermoproteus sp.]